jgi:hypothetical protein
MLDGLELDVLGLQFCQIFARCVLIFIPIVKEQRREEIKVRLSTLRTTPLVRPGATGLCTWRTYSMIRDRT